MNEARKIAIVLPSLRGGGAEKAMLLFAGELIRRSVEVHLLVGMAAGQIASAVPDGVIVHDLNVRRTIAMLPRLIGFLRSERPDAVYATITHANVVTILARALSLTRTKVVVREANVALSEPRTTLIRKATLWMVPFTYRFATSIIAVAEAVATELRGFLPSIADRILVVPTPVVYPELFSLAEATPDHPWLLERGRPLIVSAARLQPHKGFVTLVEAIARIHTRGIAVRALILGDGPERETILRRIRELSLTESVELVGFQQNPFPFMKRASVFVLASEYEGTSNVIIQALALGTPVVATDCPGGSREILDNGNFGTLVPVGDPEALANGILQAIKTPLRHIEAVEAMAVRYGVRTATDGYLAAAALIASDKSP